MATDPTTLPRKHQCIIYTLGTIQELVDLGLLDQIQGRQPLTAGGMATYKALKDSGFSMTAEEEADSWNGLGLRPRK